MNTGWLGGCVARIRSRNSDTEIAIYHRKGDLAQLEYTSALMLDVKVSRFTEGPLEQSTNCLREA